MWFLILSEPVFLFKSIDLINLVFSSSCLSIKGKQTSLHTFFQNSHHSEKSYLKCGPFLEISGNIWEHSSQPDSSRKALMFASKFRLTITIFS